MAISVVTIGSESAADINTISFPAYNQAAGNCVAISTSSTNVTVVSITDTAGNIYVPAISNFTDGVNLTYGSILYAQNCLGNPENIITILYSGTVLFGGAYAYDIAGADPVFPVDVVFSNFSAVLNLAPEASVTTTFVDEAIIVLAAITAGAGTMSAPTLGGVGITDDGTTGGNISGYDGVSGGHTTVSSTQTGVLAAFTLSTPRPWIVLGVAFQPPLFSVSGNAGAGGVTVNYSGDAGGSVIADPFGNYNISGLFPGSYTVTPQSPFYNFSPTSRAVTVTNANITGLNFTATQSQTSTSGSGSVTLLSQPLSGVTITWTGPTSGQTVTDTTGNWTTGNTLFTGLYAVTPSLAGYTFAPPEIFALVARTIVEINFRARPSVPSGVVPPPELHFVYLGTPSAVQTGMNNPDDSTGSNVPPTLNQGSQLIVVPPSFGRSGEIRGRFDQFNVMNNPA